MQPLPPKIIVSNLTFDGKRYEEIFPQVFHEELADHMGITLTPQTLEVLQQGHYHAYQAFFIGALERENFRSEKAENAKLEQVANDAERLMLSLAKLYGFGLTEEKIVTEIKSNPTCYVGPEGGKLSDLLDGNRPDNPLFSFRQFLSDLYISAKRATNHKPPDVYPKDRVAALLNGGEISQETLKTLEDMALNRDWNLTDDREKDIECWRERSQAHKRPKDYALLEFIKAFRPVWDELTTHSFTHGHYFGGEVHTSSRLVDAVKLSVDQHSPTITRQNVVTAIRKINSNIVD